MQVLLKLVKVSMILTLPEVLSQMILQMLGEVNYSLGMLKQLAGTAKMGVLATTTFLNSTLGLAVGIGTAINEGRWSGLWDNQVNKYLNEINEASEKALPNYYTNEEREEPWYNNIFTANFLGDKVLKNMGFTMGAIAAGALTGNFGSSLLARIGTAGSLVAKGSNIASKVLATTVSAAGEASIEALHASNDYMKMNTQFIEASVLEDKNALDSKYAQYMEQLEEEYAGGKKYISSYR